MRVIHSRICRAADSLRAFANNHRPGRKTSRSDRRPAAHAHRTLSHDMVFFLLKKNDVAGMNNPVSAAPPREPWTILAEGAIALSVTFSGGALIAS